MTAAPGGGGGSVTANVVKQRLFSLLEDVVCRHCFTLIRIEIFQLLYLHLVIDVYNW